MIRGTATDYFHSTAKRSGKGEEKSREKSEEKILKMILKKPNVTTREMMDSLGLSRAGIEKIVKKLKQNAGLAVLDQIRAGIGKW